MTPTYHRACAAVIRDHSILMVHCRHRTHAHWTLPGGGVEPGETPEAAAGRELWEEATVRGEHPELLYERAIREGRETCFLLQVSPDQVATLGRDPELEQQGQELVEVAWRALTEVRDDVQVSRVIAALAQRGVKM